MKYLVQHPFDDIYFSFRRAKDAYDFAHEAVLQSGVTINVYRNPPYYNNGYYVVYANGTRRLIKKSS